MAEQKIKGSILKSRLEFVRNEFGEDGLNKIMDNLPEEDQKILGRLVAVAWVDFEVGKRLDEAIVKALELCGAKNVRIMEERCRADVGDVCSYRVSWS